MRNRILLSVVVIAAIATIAMALIPPPPVNQNLSFYDASLVNMSATTCLGCHGIESVPDRHHQLLADGSIPYGCLDCHPMQGVIPNRTMYIERDCTQCHGGFAFPANPVVNLTARPPHHNTSFALARDCVHCHGISVVDNYNTPGLYRPTYKTSLVTPYADNKVWNATGYSPNQITYGLPNSSSTNFTGRYWGGCLSCHQASINVPAGSPNILNNHDTHHTAIGSTSGKCNWCHVINEPSGNANSVQRIKALAGQGGPLNGLTNPLNLNATYPYGRIMEFRNSSYSAVNGTGCENCHSVRSLHNIQTAATGLTVDQTITNGVSGWGHIASNADCNGCHAFWSAGAVENPFPGPISMNLASVTPVRLIAGVATDVTITGSNFVQGPYTTKVTIDGVLLNPKSVTDTQIVVTVPKTTLRGIHDIQVDKGGVTSALSTLTVVEPVTITSAQLTSGVLTIAGEGFGTVDQKIVVIEKAGAVVTSDSITSWVDTKIVAASAQAAVGDTVTVTTPTGATTATITSGAVITPTPTATPKPSITVTSPNGGESYKRGTTQTIKWSNVGSTGGFVKIELLQGTSASTITSKVSNSGTYSWKISNRQSIATNYQIRVTSTTNKLYKDTSNNNFAIKK